MAEVSFAVNTIGLIIPFVLIDPFASGATSSVPISTASGITSTTWVAHTGKRRPLTLSQASFALFTYTISAADSRSPHIEEGYLEVRFEGNVFATSTFRMCVYQHF
ncbi:MAG TPA: hypothetical protein VI542_24615 [Candidatus Tectomicrobia bacterium]